MDRAPEKQQDPVGGPFRRLVDRFEQRGVYVPGEEDRSLSPGRDFSWLIALWLLGLALFVLLFAALA